MNGPDLPADPSEPFELGHWQWRWPMGAEKVEMVEGAPMWSGQFDSRDVATAQRTFPGRQIYLDAGGSLYVVPAGPGGDALIAKLRAWDAEYLAADPPGVD